MIIEADAGVILLITVKNVRWKQVFV
jgi:hypothetical protein